MTRQTSERRAEAATAGASTAKAHVDLPENGENRAAIEDTLTALKDMGRLERVDAAKVQMLRSMADALDRKPWNSQMWKVYGEAIEGLIAGGSDDDELAALLTDLSSADSDTEED